MDDGKQEGLLNQDLLESFRREWKAEIVSHQLHEEEEDEAEAELNDEHAKANVNEKTKKKKEKKNIDGYEEGENEEHLIDEKDFEEALLLNKASLRQQEQEEDEDEEEGEEEEEEERLELNGEPVTKKAKQKKTAPPKPKTKRAGRVMLTGIASS
eukprot:m.5906 g.5906  ORF g.5906 m.5906 type:complete len:155 (+) comp2510_c0_seq1:189-653(+)